MRKWGKSWRFFESQYHLIREKDRDRKRSSEVSGFSIAVHIRRGDSGRPRPFEKQGRGYPPETYVSSVDALLRLSSNEDSNETRKMAEGQPLTQLRKTFGVVDNRNVTITVLAEEDADQQDAKDIVARFEELKEKYPGKISETRYFFGKPEKNESQARARWVHDMDQLSTSDLLILSSSYYSALAAALQRAKHAFTLMPKDREESGAYELGGWYVGIGKFWTARSRLTS